MKKPKQKRKTMTATWAKRELKNIAWLYEETLMTVETRDRLIRQVMEKLEGENGQEA